MPGGGPFELLVQLAFPSGMLASWSLTTLLCFEHDYTIAFRHTTSRVYNKHSIAPLPTNDLTRRPMCDQRNLDIV